MEPDEIKSAKRLTGKLVNITSNQNANIFCLNPISAIVMLGIRNR